MTSFKLASSMAGPRPNFLRAWLQNASTPAFSAYAIVAAFTTYFSMYAFRKPFAAATFSDQALVVPGMDEPLDLKLALVLSQVIGYALSKFISIKIVSEVAPAKRAMTLILLVGFAELSLLAFAVLPPWGKVFAIFCNGLPLGAVWGLVFGFLEGRRTSEILGAGLSTSYIVASGAVKTVGRWLLTLGVSASWMPFLTGLMFTAPFLLSVFLLRQLPPPTVEDQQQRSVRAPMGAAERRAFFLRFAPGLIALTGLYMFLTAYRDFRDNFAAEVWVALGYGAEPEVFTYTELPIAFGVLIALALIYRIQSNRKAFFVVHALMAGGSAIIGFATLAFELGLVGPIFWMTAVGMGLYLAYVPYGSMLFDRLMATTRTVGTAVFMIYVTDAFGYLGSIIVVLVRSFGPSELSWLGFFIRFSYVTAIICSVAFLYSALYFRHSAPSQDEPPNTP